MQLQSYNILLLTISDSMYQLQYNLIKVLTTSEVNVNEQMCDQKPHKKKQVASQNRSLNVKIIK